METLMDYCIHKTSQVSHISENKVSFEHSFDYQVLENLYQDILMEYFGEDFSTIENRFHQDICFDYILENLQTHDWKKCAEAIDKEFNQHIKSINQIGSKDTHNRKEAFCVEVNSSEDMEKIVSSDKFKNIIEFFGYEHSHNLDNHIFIEPIFTELANNYIYRDCKGIVFHLTDKESAERILKSGLRIKNRKHNMKYREYPQRIYVIGLGNFNNIKRQLREIANSMGFTNCTVLRIDLNRSKANIYKDTAVNNKNCFFLYQNIPSEWIKIECEI